MKFDIWHFRSVFFFNWPTRPRLIGGQSFHIWCPYVWSTKSRDIATCGQNSKFARIVVCIIEPFAQKSDFKCEIFWHFRSLNYIWNSFSLTFFVLRSSQQLRVVRQFSLAKPKCWEKKVKPCLILTFSHHFSVDFFWFMYEKLSTSQGFPIVVSIQKNHARRKKEKKYY